MDMQTFRQVADRHSYPETPAKMVVGARQLRKALLAGKARKVYLAENADPALTEPIEALCQQNGVPCVWVSSMQELGKRSGIEVGAAAAAAID